MRYPLGEYDKAATIERKLVNGRDLRGDAVGPWESIEDGELVFVRMRSQGAAESELVGQLGATATYQINLRFVPNVDESLRLRLLHEDGGSRILNFVSVENVDEADHELEILAEERRP